MKNILAGVILAFFVSLVNVSYANEEIKFEVKDTPIVMVKCSAGSFMMGSPSGPLGELGRNNTDMFNNETLHKVTISKDFYIAKFPVTQAQYMAVMGKNPSKFQDDNNPVERVSWFMAKEFCDKLNEITESTRLAGYRFDLPTEAQWEYACRAGTTTALNSGKNITTAEEKVNCPNLDEVGWYESNSDGKTHPVGLKKPNAWGIYDMHGNVSEWCADYWADSYDLTSLTDPIGPASDSCRVCRGGSWCYAPKFCRSAKRNGDLPERAYYDFGFRVVLVPEK